MEFYLTQYQQLNYPLLLFHITVDTQNTFLRVTSLEFRTLVCVRVCVRVGVCACVRVCVFF